MDKPVRVALWGGFDVANYGDLLFPRIFESEFRRRLPEAEISIYSPLGNLNPVPMDGGNRALPLGTWSEGTCRRYADKFDLVVVGGGDIIHVRDDLYPSFYGSVPDGLGELQPSRFYIDGLGPELESRCPMAWNAVGVPFEFAGSDAGRVSAALNRRSYISVRDHASRDRLLRSGVTAEVKVVPDTAFRLPSLFGERHIAERLALLRDSGAYPQDFDALVIQANGYLSVETVDEIALEVGVVLAEYPNLRPVLVEIGPCHQDGRFADLLAARLPRPVYRLDSASGLIDIAAALAGARLYLGTSLHGHITCFCYGVPGVILDLQRIEKLETFAGMAGREGFVVSQKCDIADALRRAQDRRPDRSLLAGLMAEVDEHFDRLASLAERPVPR